MDFSSYEPHLHNLRSMVKKVIAEEKHDWRYSYMDILDMNEANSEYTLNNVPSNAVALLVFDYQGKCKENNTFKHNRRHMFLNSDKTFLILGNDTTLRQILLDWLQTIH